MKTIKKLSCIFALVACLLTCTGCTGCRKVNQVNYNISLAADNFEIYRCITVVNVRDNLVLYELEGFFALDNDSENELIVTSRIGEDKYKKDYIYLNEYTSYVVEQKEAENIDPYHYELRIIPKMLPVTEFNVTD